MVGPLRSLTAMSTVDRPAVWFATGLAVALIRSEYICTVLTVGIRTTYISKSFRALARGSTLHNYCVLALRNAHAHQPRSAVDLCHSRTITTTTTTSTVDRPIIQPVPFTAATLGYNLQE